MNKDSPIEVSVVTEYLPRQSEPLKQQFAFAYHITISNHGNKAAQLVSRHWIITDGNEATQEVQGLGVVGEQPMINPGESYRYTSGVILETEIGTMSGTYHMLCETGVSFDAPIPTFLLAVPNAIN
ncbi:MAG TPA: Co2+/Mg2+ efflux protein ApaG [Porticoccaceae bacterium]|nr:Co2+/Mg2+ efflux protein ApaG [Porticoccaceae bacterium]HCO59290.1 Co2+/Mg2+ efflux protein ApaG [Porticoccaceae bacterium]